MPSSFASSFPSWVSALLLLPAAIAVAQPACSARAGARAPTVVELYTSEGCSSCPPADRWLSTLKGRGDVIALAFHVDYWDRLGWTDRYASPAWTRRQNEVAARGGARFVYTPQVVVDGRDYKRWPSLPEAGTAAPVGLALHRDGIAYVAELTRPAGAPRELSGYWAVTEDGHRTQVRAGENAGATLQHDAVVRELVAVPSIGDAPLRFTPQPPAGTDASVTRHVLFVVTDPRSGAPLQAVALGC